MKTLITYSSQTGFTKKYATWLSEELKADCIPLKEAKKVNLDDYDKIIYGGWFCAENIMGLDKFIKKANKLSTIKNKQVAIFGVGSGPIENPELVEVLKKINSNISTNFGDDFNYKLFYCQGGFSYEKMNLPSRLAMKLFVKMLKSQKNKTPADEAKIKMISSSFDATDKKFIEPIIDFIK